MKKRNRLTPIEKRIRAHTVWTEGQAATLRLSMAQGNCYTAQSIKFSNQPATEYVRAMDRADLVQFISQLDTADLQAVCVLVATLLAEPRDDEELLTFIEDRRADAEARELAARKLKGKRGRIPKAFRDFIKGLDM